MAYFAMMIICIGLFLWEKKSKWTKWFMLAGFLLIFYVIYTEMQIPLP
jgi:hypothetical protein